MNAWRLALLGVASLLLACAPGDLKAGLGPGDSSPTERLVVTPASTTVATDGMLTFSALITLQDGATAAPLVEWSATGGTITSGGVYTAGSSTGTFRVIAVQQGGGLVGSSLVTVASAAGMYFNSSEAGCGTDANVVLCDDFEDGDWYGKDCDQATNTPST